MNLLKLANLSLLILFPISWFAPLMSAGLLPIFGLDQISIATALKSLWEEDLFLAVLVTFFAILAPVIKITLTTLIHFEKITMRAKPFLEVVGKLAMADVFLVSIYIVATKGVGIGRVETEWGLYLFTFCVLASMYITHLTKKPIA